MPTIYALIDPRDHLIHYIGMTGMPLPWRLTAHLYDAKSGFRGPKQDWLRSVVASGAAPVPMLLEHLERKLGPRDRRFELDRERDWIHRMASAGAPLTNIVHHRPRWAHQRSA